MKPSKFIGFTILILAFFLVGNTGWAEEGVKDKYAPAPKTIEGWVEYPELIPSQTPTITGCPKVLSPTNPPGLEKMSLIPVRSYILCRTIYSGQENILI